MKASRLVLMALDIVVDSGDDNGIAEDLRDLIETHGLANMLDALRGVADGAIEVHVDDPALTGTIERLRAFSVGLATAHAAVQS